MTDTAELIARADRELARTRGPTYAELHKLANELHDALAAQAQEIERLNKEIRGINAHTSACSVELFNMTQRADGAEARVRELETLRDANLASMDILIAERNTIEAATIERCKDEVLRLMSEGAFPKWGREIIAALDALAKEPTAAPPAASE